MVRAGLERLRMDAHTIDEITFSFVCTIYNQADRLEQTCEQIKVVAETLGEKYEIILINDGSTDSSLEVIRKLAKQDGSVKYVDFSRTFGRSAAVKAGMDYACGKAVISVDAEYPTAVDHVVPLVEKWQAGAEIVFTTGADSGKTSLCQRLRHKVRQSLPHVCGADSAADWAIALLLDRKAVSALRRIPEQSQCIPTLVRWIGFRQASVQVRDGTAGTGSRACHATHGLEGAARDPLLSAVRAVGWIGAAMFLADLGYSVIGGTLALFGLTAFSWLFALVLGVFGIQLLCLGMIGERVGRACLQAKTQPSYFVRYAHGFEDEQDLLAVEPPARQPEQASRFNVLT